MPSVTPATIGGALREAMRLPRLLLAAKTAVAVGIAWAIAPHMPGITDEYPYYAPLGALVSMYPTLMGSAKSGLQTLLGLAAGIGLATLVILTVGPTWWTIPVIVGIGIVLSGTGWFGVGREYVPMAALFVLIIGGQDADSYSLGYLVQMAVGVVVGLAVNFVMAPATTSAAAAARVDDFQLQIANHVREIGTAIRASWPPENDAWERNASSLAITADDVRAALTEGDESRKGNPRALLRKRDTSVDHQRLETLDTVTFHVRDISSALADTIWHRPGAFEFDNALTEPLGAACDAIAEAIERYETDSDRSREAASAADDAVAELTRVVDARSVEAGHAMGPGVLTAMHLRRIAVHLR